MITDPLFSGSVWRQDFSKGALILAPVLTSQQLYSLIYLSWKSLTYGYLHIISPPPDRILGTILRQISPIFLSFLSLSPFPQSPPLVLREMTLETLPPKDGERRKIKRDHSAARNSSYCREPSKFRSREGVKGKSRESTDGLFDLGVNFCLVGTFASSSLSAEGKIARTAGIRVRELQ